MHDHVVNWWKPSSFDQDWLFGWRTFSIVEKPFHFFKLEPSYPSHRFWSTHLGTTSWLVQICLLRSWYPVHSTRRINSFTAHLNPKLRECDQSASKHQIESSKGPMYIIKSASRSNWSDRKTCLGLLHRRIKTNEQDQDAKNGCHERWNGSSFDWSLLPRWGTPCPQLLPVTGVCKSEDLSRLATKALEGEQHIFSPIWIRHTKCCQCGM